MTSLLESFFKGACNIFKQSDLTPFQMPSRIQILFDYYIYIWYRRTQSLSYVVIQSFSFFFFFLSLYVFIYIVQAPVSCAFCVHLPTVLLLRYFVVRVAAAETCSCDPLPHVCKNGGSLISMQTHVGWQWIHHVLDAKFILLQSPKLNLS